VSAIFIEQPEHTQPFVERHQKDLDPLTIRQEESLEVSLTHSEDFSEEFLQAGWASETAVVKELVSNLLSLCKGHLRRGPAFVSLTSAIAASSGASLFHACPFEQRPPSSVRRRAGRLGSDQNARNYRSDLHGSRIEEKIRV
jgi:hypothetical protein